jgi:hypothetical protein
MKLIPFDLKLAQEGHPIQTRDGRHAKFIAHVPETREEDQVVCLIDGLVCSRFDTGLQYDSKASSPNDLFMAPMKHTKWLNIYPEGRTSYAYPTKELANSNVVFDRFDRIACIQITYTEGEGL